MIKNLVDAVASEYSLLRSLGVSGIHFTVEVHLTKSTLEYLKATEYINIFPNEDNITFMNCPVIEDTTDFVCTIHRINLVEGEYND